MFDQKDNKNKSIVIRTDEIMAKIKAGEMGDKTFDMYDTILSAPGSISK